MNISFVLGLRHYEQVNMVNALNDLRRYALK